MPLMPLQRGIWRPSGFDAALSIVTVYRANPADRPYEDAQGDDGYMRYKWRGTDGEAWDNVALRRAMQTQRWLIWFVGVAPGVYEPVFPVYLVGEEPAEHQFVVALDDESRMQWGMDLSHPADTAIRKQYVERIVKQRLHQPVFRGRVIAAYGGQCALCRLRHVELLDAAHIRPDSMGGEPIVPNGLAMCAIHHRAFDADVLGITPDLKIEIKEAVLRETDGPTLRHTLQELHGETITVPARVAEKPNREFIEERYQAFLAAS